MCRTELDLVNGSHFSNPQFPIPPEGVPPSPQNSNANLCASLLSPPLSILSKPSPNPKTPVANPENAYSKDTVCTTASRFHLCCLIKISCTMYPKDTCISQLQSEIRRRLDHPWWFRGRLEQLLRCRLLLLQDRLDWYLQWYS